MSGAFSDGRHLIQSVIRVSTRGNKTKKFEIGTRNQVSFQPAATEVKDSNHADRKWGKRKGKKKGLILPKHPEVGLATIVSDSSAPCLVKTKGLFFFKHNLKISHIIICLLSFFSANKRETEAPPPAPRHPPPVAETEPATLLSVVPAETHRRYFSVLASAAAAAALWLLGLASSLAAGPWALGAELGLKPAWLWGRLEGREGCRRRPSPLDECLLRPPSSMGGCGRKRSGCRSEGRTLSSFML